MTVKTLRHIEIELSIVWLWSVIISVLISSAATIILPIGISHNLVLLACAGLGVVIGGIISWLYSWNIARDILTALFHIVPGNSVLRDVIDWEHGADLKIQMKGADYYLIGPLNTMGGTGEDQWVSISNPEKWTLDNMVLESWEDDDRTYMVIPLSEVEYITIINGNEEIKE